MNISRIGNSSIQNTTNDFSHNIEQGSMQPQKSGTLSDSPSQPEKKEVTRIPSDKEIEKAITEMNRKMVNAEAVFSRHDETGRTAIKIIDKETKEVIKEFPSEESLDMLAKIWKMAGIIVDEKR